MSVKYALFQGLVKAFGLKKQWEEKMRRSFSKGSEGKMRKIAFQDSATPILRSVS